VVQVDPIEPTLTAPGSERLKLKCNDLLSHFAFKFNLRLYNMVARAEVEYRAAMDLDGAGAAGDRTAYVWPEVGPCNPPS
jgi:hypothetical protein